MVSKMADDIDAMLQGEDQKPNLVSPTEDKNMVPNPDEGGQTPEEVEYFNSLKGSSRERFEQLYREKVQAERELNDLRAGANRIVPPPPPQFNPDVKQAVQKLDEVGMATKDYTDNKVNQTLNQLRYEMELDVNIAGGTVNATIDESSLAKESGGNLDKLVAPITTINTVKGLLVAIMKTDGTQFDPTLIATSAKQSPPTSPLAADQTGATGDTNVVTVTQAGILGASLYNPSTSITMYVWFGAAPSAGSQIVLPPLASKDVQFKVAVGNMQYKSSAIGGTLIYELDG